MSEAPGRDLLGGRGHMRGLLLPLSFVVVVAAALLNLAGPQPLGRTMMIAVVLPLVLTIAIAPLARGARPVRIWLLVTMGVPFLFLGLTTRTAGFSIGRFEVSEAFYVVGYLCLSSWLWQLARHIGAGRAALVLLDATAAIAGTFLALWSLAGVLGQTRNVAALVWALYPVLDVLALALAVHLAFGLSRPVRAWRWVIAGIVLQLVIDTVYFVLGLVVSVGPRPGFGGLYLFTYWTLAVGACRPTIVELTRVRDRTRREVPGRLRHAPVVLAVAPAIVALAVPVDGPVDGVVRSSVVIALLLCLFARLLITMSALAKAESTSRHRSLHDPLTGLVNRAGLFDVLERRLERDADTGVTTVLLFLDCDDFKNVNDTWGHAAGDTLLCSIADGLPRRFRTDDVLARHGGDEFVIIASVQDPEDALLVAEHALSFFEMPLPVLEGRTHRMTPSIGITVAGPESSASPIELLERADIALYKAKDRGRAQFAVYDDELETEARYRAAVFDAFRTAVYEERITLGYQPILRGEGYQELAGWEALARWSDPVLGEVPPSVFIPLAEEHRLIAALGESILRRACRDLVVLRRELGRPDSIVSVNVSALQLKRAEFADVVADALASAGLRGDALWLEVTEKLLLETNPEVLHTIRRIQGLGVVLALDDFGTGSSPIDLFLHRSVDCVKLDKSLIHRLGEEPLAQAQLRAFLDLLATLPVTRVVAEGVENPEQAAALQALGCPMVQGWLYSRALPLEQVLAGAREDVARADVPSPLAGA